MKKVKSSSPFTVAVTQLQKQPDWSVFGPESFQGYLSNNGIQAPHTARHISVNTLSDLDALLTVNEMMVFRLGASGQGNTSFALVKAASGRLCDFFLDPDQCLHRPPPQTFLPDAPMRDLFPYFLIGGGLTEGSLVNFVFASGAISWALGLDRHLPSPAPAKGNGVYTFSLSLHRDCATEFVHLQGQVDVDAAFLGRRGGKELFFVLEAKHSTNSDPLAKHKLTYPVLAIAPRVPRDIPIIPLYLRSWVEKSSFRYELAECSFPDPRLENAPGVDSLVIERVSQFSIPMLNVP